VAYLERTGMVKPRRRLIAVPADERFFGLEWAARRKTQPIPGGIARIRNETDRWLLVAAWD
jgi:hypothetical protein